MQYKMPFYPESHYELIKVEEEIKQIWNEMFIVAKEMDVEIARLCKENDIHPDDFYLEDYERLCQGFDTKSEDISKQFQITLDCKRCIAMTKQGNQCKNRSNSGLFCSHHYFASNNHSNVQLNTLKMRYQCTAQTKIGRQCRNSTYGVFCHVHVNSSGLCSSDGEPERKFEPFAFPKCIGLTRSGVPCQKYTIDASEFRCHDHYDRLVEQSDVEDDSSSDEE